MSNFLLWNCAWVKFASVPPAFLFCHLIPFFFHSFFFSKVEVWKDNNLIFTWETVHELIWETRKCPNHQIILPKQYFFPSFVSSFLSFLFRFISFFLCFCLSFTSLSFISEILRWVRQLKKQENTSELKKEVWYILYE